MVVSDSILIDVFEMLINRIDTMNDTVSKMSDYLVSDARFKTNNIISGKIFNYPFEIQNYKFDKKRFAFVSIKLKDKLSHKTLYDIIWAVLSDEEIIDYRDSKIMEKMKENIKKEFGLDKYNEFLKGIKIYLTDENEEYLTCKKYNIDTIYEYLPEYLINKFVVSTQEKPIFNTFNHIGYNMNISFENDENIYIDDLINKIMDNMKQYGYTINDINEMKIVGLDSIFYNFIKLYNLNEFNHELIKPHITKYLDELCPCIKEKIKASILEYINDGCQILPVLNNKELQNMLPNLLDIENNFHF
jgi:hypothetical protein